MPQPKNRSNSVRRIKRRGPSGKSVTAFRRRVTGNKHYCAVCKAKLAGVCSTPGLAASERTPNRKFAGCLCHACQRAVVREAARVNMGVKEKNTVPLNIIKYVMTQVRNK